jgi:hypothetical protein
MGTLGQIDPTQRLHHGRKDLQIVIEAGIGGEIVVASGLIFNKIQAGGLQQLLVLQRQLLPPGQQFFQTLAQEASQSQSVRSLLLIDDLQHTAVIGHFL